MKLRVFEAFAGYGSQAMALKRLKADYPDFDFEVVGVSEIDPYAIQAYRAVHGEDAPNYGDISKINWGGIALILTYLHIPSLAKIFLRRDCSAVSPRVQALARRCCGSATRLSRPSGQSICLWRM